MDKIVYEHIRNLSWDLLMDSNANELPIKITPIAKLYSYEKHIDYNKSRYENTLLISSYILDAYGLNLNTQCPKFLAIRTLAPSCVLMECKINNISTLSELTNLPLHEAKQRFERLQLLIQRKKFYLSEMEVKVVEQFHEYIINYNNQNNI